jgi:hypothetical protein
MANKTLATIALLASTAVLVLVVAGTMVNKEKKPTITKCPTRGAALMIRKYIS